MIAIVCDWGGDLLVGPGGDIGTAPVQFEVEQRLVRRLLTNPGDYIWHTTYGGGLGSFVGQPCSPALIEGTILGQLQQETLVAPDPAPTVQTNQSLSGSFSTISVTVQFQVTGISVSTSVTLGLGT
jgi:hypothetical protein